MLKKIATAVLLLIAVPGRAGDSAYGRVAAVRSAELLLMDFGTTRYMVRLAGIDAPNEAPLAAEARQFVARLVLDKPARMRLHGRNKAGEMVSRVLTDDPDIGIKDVGIELVRAGLAHRLATTAYKYRELELAEAEARKERRGMWGRAR